MPSETPSAQRRQVAVGTEADRCVGCRDHRALTPDGLLR
jgi:hypothetical protein